MTDTKHDHHPNLSVDQQLALRTAASRLRAEFDGTFGQETIERFLRSSYDQFASPALVPNFPRAVAWSGGSEPGYEVNPSAVAAMAERGIDITGEFPKPWTDEIVQAADVVITMGCGDACPVFPGKRYWTGSWTTRPARASRTSAQCGMRSKAGSAGCWTSWASPPSHEARSSSGAAIAPQAAGRVSRQLASGRAGDRIGDRRAAAVAA
jgi:hypothetical protein